MPPYTTAVLLALLSIAGLTRGIKAPKDKVGTVPVAAPAGSEAKHLVG